MKFRKALIAVSAGIALQAVAQTAPTTPAPGTAPSPASTYDKLARGEPLQIGVRASSAPLSYAHGGSYIGLAVDLCNKTFEKVKETFPKATFKYVEVTSSNRIEFLKAGKIDMECGSTTNTANRRKEVNFSTPYYVASVVAIKLKSNKLTSIRDVDGNSTVIYTNKTSTENALKSASIIFNSKAEAKTFKTILGKDHQESFDMLTAGKGDIFANDDILLMGLQQRSLNPDQYELLQEKYSVEPYAVMTRKDDDWITLTTDKTIINSMRDRTFDVFYAKWFLNQIPPSNINLNIPMSRFLKETTRMPSNIVGN
jgi:glutamate/aspartate transport system substrate-binding protein